MNFDEWQRNEEEKIRELDAIVDKIRRGYKIHIWEVVPELQLGKSKLVWGMIHPKILREGYLASRPQVFLLPINAPQYKGWSFRKEYGCSPSKLTNLIKTCPDRIKPIITAQPLDYRSHNYYDEIFKACREVYGDVYVPCSQWRVDALISKYRMTFEDEFREYFSDQYFRLAEGCWALRVMESFGFPSSLNPNTIEGNIYVTL